MKIESEYSECPKCGFKDTSASRIANERKCFVMEYQDRCYASSCSWADRDVTEHMHVICPDCGYMVGVQGCVDYKALKEKKNTNLKPWTGFGTATHPVAATHTKPTSGRTYVAGRGYVDVGSDGWDTAECPSCPMSKENTDVETVER